MHWVYYAGRFLSKVILVSLSNWQVKGRKNVPKQGPLLIVSNHLHVVDPPIIAASTRLKTVLMAKEELFLHWYPRYFVQNFGAFPVRRRGADLEAFRQAGYWLKQEASLIMFPEGKRSSTIQMQTAFSGSTLIACKLNIPILPVGITGTEKLREPGWWQHRPKIMVNFGRPFRLLPVDGKLTRGELARLTRLTMENIAELLPPQYRGIYNKGENEEDREGK